MNVTKFALALPLAFAVMVACPCATLRAATGGGGKTFLVTGKPELVERGLVSTPKSEVKITFSPDGSRMLWGTIGWENGAGGWDVWESVRAKGSAKNAATWGPPHTVAFDSADNDFDPSFAPDGSGVYFFSNRTGGLGGDDIYFAPFDRKTGVYGTAMNLGPSVNTKGDEWGPAVSPDGRRLLFCTDGMGGRGKHDLFVSVRDGAGWQPARSLGEAVNTAADDFDAAWLDDGRSIVFASGDLESGAVRLYASLAEGRDGAYGAPIQLADAVTSPTFLNFGCSTTKREPGVLYFTSNFEGSAVGRADLYRVTYTLANATKRP